MTPHDTRWLVFCFTILLTSFASAQNADPPAAGPQPAEPNVVAPPVVESKPADALFADLTKRRDELRADLKASEDAFSKFDDDLSAAFKTLGRLTALFDATFIVEGSDTEPKAVTALKEVVADDNALLTGRLAAVQGLAGWNEQLSAISKQADEAVKAFKKDTSGLPAKFKKIAAAAKNYAESANGHPSLALLKSDFVEINTDATEDAQKAENLINGEANPMDPKNRNDLLTGAEDLAGRCKSIGKTIQSSILNVSSPQLQLGVLLSLGKSEDPDVRENLVKRIVGGGAGDVPLLALSVLSQQPDSVVPTLVDVMKNTEASSEVRLLAGQIVVKRANQLLAKPDPKVLKPMLEKLTAIALPGGGNAVENQIRALAAQALATLARLSVSPAP